MKKIKNAILKFVNKPEDGILSSQTLYESLFYLLNSHEIAKTAAAKSKIEVDAKELALFICEYQLKDGGFDLGYNFIFGKGLEKKHEKEGTSPELLAITALSLYYQNIEPNEIIYESITKGIDWILSRVIPVGDLYAIPYAPDSYDKIHITNATSFALSALAVSYPLFDGDKKVTIKRYVKGMYEFMFNQLELKTETEAFWPYFYMNGSPDELSLVNDKVDNYHISQQLYHHMLAETFISDSKNSKTIELVINYLVNSVDSKGFVPYTYSAGKTSDKVDVWGFASLIAAFSYYSIKFSDKRTKQCAESVCDYLLNYCYNDVHFYPIILNSNKTIFDGNFYPRSDAWVIHALSEYCLLLEGHEKIEKITNDIYDLIRKDNHQGLENHTITLRKKLFAKIVIIVKSLIGK